MMIFEMPRCSRRSRAAKAAKRNPTGSFVPVDSEDDMDVTLDFIDDEENDFNFVETYVAKVDFTPPVDSKKRGPYMGNAPRTKRRKAEKDRHCLNVCPMKTLEMFRFQSSSKECHAVHSPRLIMQTILELVKKMLYDHKATFKAR